MKNVLASINPSIIDDPISRRYWEVVKTALAELTVATAKVVDNTNYPDLNPISPVLTDYLYLPGRAGGQTINAGLATADAISVRAAAAYTGGTAVFEVEDSDGTARFIVRPGDTSSGNVEIVNDSLSASTGLWVRTNSDNITVSSGILSAALIDHVPANNGSVLLRGRSGTSLSSQDDAFYFFADGSLRTFGQGSFTGAPNGTGAIFCQYFSASTLGPQFRITGAKILSFDISGLTNNANRVLTVPDTSGTILLNTTIGSGLAVVDSTFTIQDNADATKLLAFECSGITTATTRTLTVPDASGTIATLENAHTVTGAWVLGDGSTTITAATIAASIYDGQGFVFRDVAAGFNAQISPGGAGGLTANRLYMFPDATGTVVLSGVSATLTGNTNSTFKVSTASSGTAFEDNTTANKRLRFITSTCSASTNTALRFNSSASRTIDFFNADDTVVGRATTDTLTNKTLTSTNVLRFDSAGTQVVMQDSTTTTKQLNFDLTSLTASTTSNVVFVGGAARTWTMPNHDMTVVGRVGSDDKTGQTAGIANVTLYTPTQNGVFRVSAYAIFTACSAPGTLTLRLTWTDTNGTHTDFPVPGIDTSGDYAPNPAISAAGDPVSWSYVLHSTTNAIQYDTAWTGTGTYNIYVRLEAL